ncbi:NKAP family protein-like, partial [Symsagittifera roscoffensis]|uniref:NKAP family protein-like n=1 Tax=Symsagittifera roscoffensis TaxID=84072 RepID=UPI00307C23B6
MTNQQTKLNKQEVTQGQKVNDQGQMKGERPPNGYYDNSTDRMKYEIAARDSAARSKARSSDGDNRSVGRKNSNKKNHLNAYYTGVDLFPDSSEGEDELEENESSSSSSSSTEGEEDEYPVGGEPWVHREIPPYQPWWTNNNNNNNNIDNKNNKDNVNNHYSSHLPVQNLYVGRQGQQFHQGHMEVPTDKNKKDLLRQESCTGSVLS